MANTFAHLDADTEYFEDIATKFHESHPHITVRLRPAYDDDIDGIGPDDADVRVTWEGGVGRLQEQGALLSVDPFIQEDESIDLSDFYPGTIWTLEGRTWAIPAGVDPAVMYYNRGLFDQYHVPYPESTWTWGDFLSAARAIRSPEDHVYGFGSMRGNVLEAMLFVYQHGGRIVDTSETPPRPEYDDPMTIEALEWFAALFHEHDVAPPPEQTRQAFVSHKVGMWVGMFANRMRWVEEMGDALRVAPLPRDERMSTGGDCHAYAISSQAEHPDACWEWIVFLSEQMPHRLVPARRSLAESSEYGQLVGSDVAVVTRLSPDNSMLVSPRIHDAFAAQMETLMVAIGKIVDGSWTPQEAMDWAQLEVQEQM